MKILLVLFVIVMNVPEKITCSVARLALKWYTEEQLEVKARKAGMSEREIARLKRCTH